MNPNEYLRDLAERIRGGSKPSALGNTAIAAVKAAWRDGKSRADAETIIDAFTADFPMMGKRGAD